MSTMRGSRGRGFDVTVYLLVTVLTVWLAGQAGGDAWYLVALLPFGLAVWRANAG